MSSGLRVISQNENPEPSPLKIYWLLDELKKKKISQKAFAKRLGVSFDVLTGRTTGGFPASKVEECLQLLENWDHSSTVAPAGGLKSNSHPWSGSFSGKGKKP